MAMKKLKLSKVKEIVHHLRYERPLTNVIRKFRISNEDLYTLVDLGLISLAQYEGQYKTYVRASHVSPGHYRKGELLPQD